MKFPNGTREQDSDGLQQRIRAVLFDVDGTLYNETALGCFVRLEFCTLPFALKSCRSAYRVWRSLRYFRRVREQLRSLGEPQDQLAALQYVEAAHQAGEDPAEMEKAVTEWIYQRPLKYLRACRRLGLDSFLTFLEQRGVRAGVFSDYPVVDKLQALGLANRMSLALCATDLGINAFKPHPKGFRQACALWGLPPQEVLYVGDRPEVDALGAANAGMPCALLVGRGQSPKHINKPAASVTFSSFARLQETLIQSC